MIGSILKHSLSTLDMLRKEAALANISMLDMLFQTVWFCLKTGLGPRYYVVAGMARSSFSNEDKWNHISARKYYSALDKLNPPAYQKLTQNKISEKSLCLSLGIPSAEFLGYYHSIKGCTTTGEPLTNTAEINSLLCLLIDNQVCIKPAEGWGGAGVVIGTVTEHEGKIFLRHLENGSETLSPLKEIFQQPREHIYSDALIIEKGIEQSSQFSSFNPDSVNTMRIWVLNYGNNRIDILGAYLRIGRAGSAVDNASAGGLMCPIALDSGTLGPAITKQSPHRAELCAHPDTGTSLAGETIEDWNAIRTFACEVLRKLPQTRFAGLDITMTAQGPLLVEANVLPDKDGAAHANIPSIELVRASEATDV